MEYIDGVKARFERALSTISEQRLQEAVDAVRRECSIRDDRLVRFYAVLALTTGTGTTLADVHDAWSAWQCEIRPDHWSLVPFDELSRDKQVKDQPYVDAIVRAASAL